MARVSNLYNRRCEIDSSYRIKLTHIGGDYIGLEVYKRNKPHDYCEIDGFGQHIVWELLERVKKLEKETRGLKRASENLASSPLKKGRLNGKK